MSYLWNAEAICVSSKKLVNTGYLKHFNFIYHSVSISVVCGAHQNKRIHENAPKMDIKRLKEGYVKGKTLHYTFCVVQKRMKCFNYCKYIEGNDVNMAILMRY